MSQVLLSSDLVTVVYLGIEVFVMCNTILCYLLWCSRGICHYSKVYFTTFCLSSNHDWHCYSQDGLTMMPCLIVTLDTFSLYCDKVKILDNISSLVSAFAAWFAAFWVFLVEYPVPVKTHESFSRSTS